MTRFKKIQNWTSRNLKHNKNILKVFRYGVQENTAVYCWGGGQKFTNRVI